MSRAGCFIAHMRICLAVKQPVRHIHPLDLVDVILIPEYPRQKLFAGQVLCKFLFCRLFIQLKRNDILGLQFPLQTGLHRDRIITKRTDTRRCILICHDLAATGLADIDSKISFLILRKRIDRIGMPIHTRIRITRQFIIVCFQRFHLKFRITIRTLHLLGSAVKLNGAATTRTFISL